MTSLHEAVCYSGEISYSDAKMQSAWRRVEEDSTVLQAVCPVTVTGTFYKRQILFCPLNSETTEHGHGSKKYNQHLLIHKKYNCRFFKGKIVNWNLDFPDYKQHTAFLMNSLQNVQMMF